MLYRRASQTKKSHTLSERPGARRSVLTWTLFLCMCEIRVGGSSVETRLERGSRSFFCTSTYGYGGGRWWMKNIAHFIGRLGHMKKHKLLLKFTITCKVSAPPWQRQTKSPGRETAASRESAAQPTRDAEATPPRRATHTPTATRHTPTRALTVERHKYAHHLQLSAACQQHAH